MLKNFSEINENDEESSNTPPHKRENEGNFNNRFHQEEELGGLDSMMGSLNINEKVPVNQTLGGGNMVN